MRAEQMWQTDAGGHGERCVHGADGRTGGRADERMGRKGRGHSSRQAEGAYKARTGEWADGRTGQSGAEELRSGGLGKRADWQSSDRADGRTSGWAWVYKTTFHEAISLLGAWSACLVRARVRRVLGSAMASSRIPRQTPVLSARTHLPRLSASVLGAEKGILLSAIWK